MPAPLVSVSVTLHSLFFSTCCLYAGRTAPLLRLRLHPTFNHPMEATQTPPPSGGEAETLAVEEKAKRARKRSRYLSPPYTDHDGATVDDDITPPEQGKEEQASLLLQQLQEANVATADLLSALLQSASASAPSPDDVLLRFFALYRTSVLARVHHSSNQGAKDDDVAHRLPNTCRAMAVFDGSAAKNVKKEDDAMGCAYGRHIGPVNAAKNGAAALEAGHKRKKVTFASDAHNATTDCSVQPTNGVANSLPKKKKARKNTGQGQHFGNPAALVLDFTQDTIDLPSKEELLSAFRRFGFLVDSETDIDKGARRARVVFGSSADAETAYSWAQTLGTFGPPFAMPRLQYLPPIKLNAPRSPSPAPKLPLTDIRKNLEKMISSLTRPSSFSKDGAHNLVGQMQGLLAKVDKLLSAGPSTTTAHHH